MKESLKHYQILEKAGEGGMGVVYKARDTRLGRIVALKVLPPAKMADETRRARFIQEARTASTLNHPNIVVVYDIDSADGVDFIAMEYVEGKNLDEIIPRGGMRLPEALKIAAQIAEGLAKAHAAGIVHRDIKPSNIRISSEGVVKILDFGLAKLTEAEPASPEDATATQRVQTQDGIIVGTAAYMSPEQIERRKLDGRSDIFSFGAVLYEMLTGRRAFTGDSQMSLLSSILQKEPSAVGDVAPGLPQELQRLVARSLRKDPERRYQHMGDVKVALQDLRDESDSGLLVEPARPSAKRPGFPRIGAAVLGLALVGAIAWTGSRRDTAPAAEPVYAPVPFATHPGDERDPTFSPDGTQIAYSWTGEHDEGLNIYVKLIGPGAPIRLTKTPGDIEPQWSPDGKWIAFMRFAGKSSIVVIPALGGPERVLREPRSSIIGWAADSQWVVADDASGSIELISIRSGEKRTILEKPDGKRATAPTLSPDSRTLAFRVQDGADGLLYSVDLDKDYKSIGKPRRLSDGPWSVVSPAFTADGKDILFINGSRDTNSSLWRVPADGSAPPRKLAWAGEYAWFLGVAQRGNRMAFTRLNRDVNIRRMQAEPGGAFRQPSTAWLPTTLIDDQPDISPDGSKVAFHSFRGGSAAIWVANVDGSQAEQITHFEGLHTRWPRWSPDGKRIAFESRGDGRQQPDIYSIAADGGGLKRLTDDGAVDGRPTWSRDGAHIYFTSGRTGRFEIWKMPSGGGAASQITREGAYFGVESPDGKSLLFMRGRAGVSRMPIGGGPVEGIPALKDVLRSVFAVTPQGVYFVQQPIAPLSTGGQSEVRASLYLLGATGPPKLLASLERVASSGLAVSADGKEVFFSQEETFGSDILLVEGFR